MSRIKYRKRSEEEYKTTFVAFLHLSMVEKGLRPPTDFQEVVAELRGQRASFLLKDMGPGTDIY